MAESQVLDEAQVTELLEQTKEQYRQYEEIRLQSESLALSVEIEVPECFSEWDQPLDIQMVE